MIKDAVKMSDLLQYLAFLLEFSKYWAPIKLEQAVKVSADHEKDSLQ